MTLTSVAVTSSLEPGLYNQLKYLLDKKADPAVRDANGYDSVCILRVYIYRNVRIEPSFWKELLIHGLFSLYNCCRSFRSCHLLWTFIKCYWVHHWRACNPCSITLCLSQLLFTCYHLSGDSADRWITEIKQRFSPIGSSYFQFVFLFFS